MTTKIKHEIFSPPVVSNWMEVKFHKHKFLPLILHTHVQICLHQNFSNDGIFCDLQYMCSPTDHSNSIWPHISITYFYLILYSLKLALFSKAISAYFLLLLTYPFCLCQSAPLSISHSVSVHLSLPFSKLCFSQLSSACFCSQSDIPGMLLCSRASL